MGQKVRNFADVIVYEWSFIYAKCTYWCNKSHLCSLSHQSICHFGLDLQLEHFHSGSHRGPENISCRFLNIFGKLPTCLLLPCSQEVLKEESLIAYKIPIFAEKWPIWAAKPLEFRFSKKATKFETIILQNKGVDMIELFLKSLGVMYHTFSANCLG